MKNHLTHGQSAARRQRGYTLRVLTFARAEAYIRRSARRPLTARLRASEAPHWNSETASDDHRMCGLRRLSGSPGGGIAMVPGCLKSVSEERETWTAESLRAASSIEDLSSNERRSGRDFGGLTFIGQHYCRESGRRVREQSRARLSAHEQEWDLVKRYDQPGKSSHPT